MADNKSALLYLGYGYGPVDTSVRTGVADANYTATASDTIVALTSLTAARTVTLPSAGSVTAGKQIIVKDESGACNGTKTITVAGVIDGTTNLVLSSAYASVRLYSNGASWNKVGA
ncbi:hypothetical protein EYC59_04885 [Candidatus Saccharibacteria bacterium]|nr:MAG: hypothetical protein EYC59_04885 [Candidatus Saccharibacteria bacterium]